MPSRIILLNVVIVGLVVSPGSNQAVNQTLPATLVFMHFASLHFCIKSSSTVNAGYLSVKCNSRMKLILLILVCVIVFIVSWMFGPISYRPSFVLVDDAYFMVQRNQFLVTGFSVWATACVYTYFVYKKILNTIIAVFFVGVLFTVYGQLGDPDSIQYIGSALVEFMVPYLAAGTLPVVLLVVITRNRISSQANT